MRFRFEQELPVPFERVKRFFGDVSNLKKITPAYPALTIVAPSTAVTAGSAFLLILDFGLFSFRWNSLIEFVNPDGTFADTFSGPVFGRWHHKHSFVSTASGTRLVDEIECEPVWWFAPFAWLFVHALFVYRRMSLPRVLR